VSLHRLDNPLLPRESALCGHFVVKYFVAGDVEQARSARLRKACEDKFPKLAAWKRDGAKTVLVLEENDLSLTNHQRVADTLLPVVVTEPNAADEIFLVSTTITDKWWGHMPASRRQNLLG
jgi:hypothetical protein